MRVLVCGGRTYAEQGRVSEVLDELRPTELITGGAKGADRLAENWARFNRVPVDVFPAQWAVHGRGAGPIRNQQMIDAGQPELVLAFPGGSGTADLVARAQAANIPIRAIH